MDKNMATIEADSRSFTTYKPICQVNDSLKKEAGFSNNHDYRLYLQRNADKIMSKQRQAFMDANKLKKCNCHHCIVLTNN